MPDVFIALAAAVVKASVSIWSHDNPLATETSSSITDLISSMLSGDLQQRRARRFFEDLEVPVARRLETLRASEFRDMPENEWTAAVLAAGDSFDKAGLTARELFTRDLDPLFLERYIRKQDRNATRDLSSAGTEFYSRLITEGCAYVIEIADKLPSFQSTAFTELLSRDTQILRAIAEILDRIPDAAAGKSAEAAFRTAYRRHIATRFDRLELFGLDFDARWYRLSVAYVSLRTEQQVNSGGQAIEDQLAANQRLMLTGRAGSGKTTVLQWLAVAAARGDFAGSLAGLNGYVPFYIRLRDYVGRKLPLPDDFLEGTAPLLAPEAPGGGNWVRQKLDSGRALVLIDGVDELPAAQRPKVVSWLSDLMERFPTPRYVITGRPTAVTEDWLADIGFNHTALESMPPSLVQTFIRNWHEATRQQVADQVERDRLDGYERSLQLEVTKDRFLRDLADTPLLAGLLCALNRHLRAALPRRRTEIYERALAMFDQRDRARQITSGDLALDLPAKAHVLGNLALWMVRNGVSELNFPLAIERIGRSLPALDGLGGASASSVFEFLLERSGLLREPASGRVDFVHKTFQEYLAASALINEDAVGELVGNAANDQWDEVVVLAAGQANKPQADQLVRGLMRSVWRGQQRYKRRVLAVACLPETRLLDPGLRRDVEASIPRLLPPQSMDQAEQLAAGGDALISGLAEHWSRDQDKAAEAIRTLSLIGGPDAMKTVQAIATQVKNRRVKSELTRAWQYFPAEEFARQVLSRAEIIDASLEEAAYIPLLAHLASLKSLYLNFSTIQASDLPLLPPLPGLTTLSMTDFSGKDLTRLPDLPKLLNLEIGRSSIASLNGIERFRNLENLYLDRCDKLWHLQRLEVCTSLSDVIFYRHVNPTALADLWHIPPLSFYFCGEVDLTPLAGKRDVKISHDPATTLRHAEVLGEGAQIQLTGESFARGLLRRTGLFG